MEPCPEQIDFLVGILLAVIVPFLSHLIFTRIFRLFRSAGDRQKGVAISAIFGLLPMLSYLIPHLNTGLTGTSITSQLPDFTYILMLYGASSYVYFHFFNMSETSRRIRILVSSGSANGSEEGCVPEDYNIDHMIAVRLERLISLGELRVKKGKYLIGRGLLLPPALIVQFFRRLLFPEHLDQTTPWSKIISFLLGTLIFAELTNTDLFTKLPSPYNGIALSLACSVIGVIAFSLLSSRACFKNYLLVSAPYLFATSGFIFSDLLPGRDSQTIHFPVFQYFAEAFANGSIAPTWLPISGGVDVGYFHINYFPFLPHRLAGYCIAALFPVSMVTAYKIQLVLGVLFFAYGWFAVIAHLTKSQQAAFWGTICILMGGTGITFHQEQVIATCHLLPWFTLCLLKIPRQHLYILPASAMFGLGLSTHYPQIQVISMSLVAIAVILWQRPNLASVVLVGKRYSWLVALLLILGSLPSLYIWRHGDELASDIRSTESIRPASYAEYLKLNQKQVSSAPAWYFNEYIRPHHENVSESTGDYSDLYGMFIGRISLLLCIVGLVFKPRMALPVLLLLTVFAEFTLGINSNLQLPKILFEAGFPFIDVFRQWYHFYPLVNFCLSLLTALGFVVLINRMDTWKSRFKLCALLFVVFMNFFELSYYDHIYLQNYCRETGPKPLQQNLYAKKTWWQTFQYRDRFKLTRDCIGAIPPALITTAYSTTAGGSDTERKMACELKSQSVVATNIPNKMAINSGQTVGVINFPKADVRPWGVSYLVDSPSPSLLVSSLNYSLGASAYVDGKAVTVWRVNSAIGGVLIEAGKHNIVFVIPGGLYAIISWIQVMLYGGTVIMLLALIEMEHPPSSFSRSCLGDVQRRQT